MSLLPLLLSTWFADLDRPLRANHDIVLAGLRPEELVVPRAAAYDRAAALDLYYRPWMDLLRRRDDASSTGIVPDRDNFRVAVDVRHFEPDEITVKVVDRCVVIEARHEEKRDGHGSVSRQFVRRYQLPERADVDRVSSALSSDGVLTVTAPLRKGSDEPDERVIKIELTGQPALRPTPDTAEDGGGIGTTTEAAAATSTGDGRTIEENEIREELTTQAQQETAKPEK